MKKFAIILLLLVSTITYAASPPSQYFLEGFVHYLDAKPVPRQTPIEATNERTQEVFESITIFPNGFYSLNVIGREGDKIIMKAITTFSAGQQTVLLPKKVRAITEVDLAKIIIGIFPVDELPDTNKLLIKSQNGRVVGWLGGSGNVVLKGILHTAQDTYAHVAHSEAVAELNALITSVLFDPPTSNVKIIKKPSGNLFNFFATLSSAVTGNVIIEVQAPT